MKKATTTMDIYNCGAMAILRPSSLDRAKEITDGCLQGGINVLEISYTISSAPEIITKLKEYYGNQIVIGAGTVLDGETARHAILAGAEFVIAPNLSEQASTVCNRYQIPYAPGCTTVTEMLKAMELGAAFVKAFPISDFYGMNLAKVFKTPIPYLPILASGGITLENLQQYVKNGCDCLGFGGLLSNGTTKEISENAKKIRDGIISARNL